jgi:hypothetical protein
MLPAGAVATNADLARIGAEARGIRMNPFEGGKAVIHRGRNFAIRANAAVARTNDYSGPPHGLRPTKSCVARLPMTRPPP